MRVPPNNTKQTKQKPASRRLQAQSTLLSFFPPAAASKPRPPPRRRVLTTTSITHISGGASLNLEAISVSDSDDEIVVEDIRKARVGASASTRRFPSACTTPLVPAAFEAGSSASAKLLFPTAVSPPRTPRTLLHTGATEMDFVPSSQLSFNTPTSSPELFVKPITPLVPTKPSWKHSSSDEIEIIPDSQALNQGSPSKGPSLSSPSRTWTNRSFVAPPPKALSDSQSDEEIIPSSQTQLASESLLMNPPKSRRSNAPKSAGSILGTSSAGLLEAFSRSQLPTMVPSMPTRSDRTIFDSLRTFPPSPDLQRHGSGSSRVLVASSVSPSPTKPHHSSCAAPGSLPPSPSTQSFTQFSALSYGDSYQPPSDSLFNRLLEDSDEWCED